MDESLFNSRIAKYGELVNSELVKCIPSYNAKQKVVFDAMRYSVTAGGKRIRPMLVLEFCRICGGDILNALPFACAVELVHTYSLIHDDLPCMDDDGMRRGKPSCHIKFGESNALLAGDALLSLAFETALCNNNIVGIGYERAARAAGELAKASGAEGMVGGQIIDLESEGKETDCATIKDMYSKKTGAMIVAAAKIGCIAAGAGNAQINAAEKYARGIGFAFQLVDDILDMRGDASKIGKPVGSDSINGKRTYAYIIGADKSEELIGRLTREAADSLDIFEDAEFLKELAVRLSRRDH